MKLVLALAVNRICTDEGAAIESLVILEGNGWGSYLEELASGKSNWQDVLEEACHCGAYEYTGPEEATERIEGPFTTIVHPIVLEGPVAEFLAPIRDLFDEDHRDCADFSKLLATLCTLAGQNRVDGGTLTDALNQIITQILKLNIPAVLPYGKSEMDYANKATVDA